MHYQLKTNELKTKKQIIIGILDDESRWARTIERLRDEVWGELDDARLYSVICKFLKRHLGFDFLQLSVFQPSGRRYELVDRYIKNDTNLKGAASPITLKTERKLEALRSRHPILLNAENINWWLANPQNFIDLGFKSGILIPLVYQRRSIGLLKLFSRWNDIYKDLDNGRLSPLVKIIAKSLSNLLIYNTMRRMAIVDGLTNVYNHRFFHEQLNREWKRARRYGSVFSLLMLDIDHFKHYNDTNGHLQGDKVLIAVAQLIRNSVRAVDIVCRYGGEEFAIILPETTIEQGLVVAEKIRQNIIEYPFKYGVKQPLGMVTVSIGLTDSQFEVESAEELVDKADAALYTAKRLGRNQCVIFKPDMIRQIS